MKQAVVIGAGPAGLMAAEALADGAKRTELDLRVLVVEAKPSVGRKFLMAGKSGLNLTKDEPKSVFTRSFYEASPRMEPMLSRMGPNAVKRFATDLGQEVFTGSSGRVFPTVMKASPLLRAWLARLASKGVEVRTRWRWQGFEAGALQAETLQAGALRFDSEAGPQTLQSDVTILALGGASWSRLGADGRWAQTLQEAGVALAPFQPANMGLHVAWSDPMAKHFGTPVKHVRLHAGEVSHLGEFVISQKGLEGSAIYAVARPVREGAPLHLDLLPGTKLQEVEQRLAKPRKGNSLANHLRKVLKLAPAKRALLMEFGRPLPSETADLARLLKHLPVSHQGPRPLDEAISVAGGVCWDAVNDDLMLTALPGVFCAGEMLDWEAPTGGYLISGCLASGKWAGERAAAYLLDQGMAA